MKKIEDYLYLYFGCEISDGNRAGILCGFMVVKYGHRVNVLHSNGLRMTYQLKTWRPLLRPLSDMTEEEAIHLNADEEYIIEIMDKYNPDRHWHLSANDMVYLLSKGFDLFGLIEAGLAIDKTKQPA